MDHKIFKSAGIMALTFLLLTVLSESSFASSDILKKLKSENCAMRMEAAKALGEAKDPAAISALVTVLKKDKDWDVRGAAEDALVNIGFTCPGLSETLVDGRKLACQKKGDPDHWQDKTCRFCRLIDSSHKIR